ncbi:MAG: glycosyltransferase [Planctomycetaceae bacterium]
MPQPASRSILLLARGLDRVGTGTQVALAAEGLVAAGWRVTLATTSGAGGLAADFERGGIDVVRLCRRPRPDWGAVMACARHARRMRPTVVVAWGRRQTRLAAAALAANGAPRLVAALAALPRGAADRTALRRVDRVIASSAEVADGCTAAGVTAAVDVVVPGSPPPPPRSCDRQALARRLGLDPAKRWTLCVAPLEPAARLRRLVWAIDQLGVVDRGLDHLLVGGGPLAAILARRARAQRIDERLTVVPHLDAVADLLAEVRLVWQSGSVAHGGALVDALAHGVPLVAVHSGAARQAIAEGVNGRIVEPRPESDFPRRAFQILDDAACAARYGVASRARAAALFAPAVARAGYAAAVERTAG